MVTTIASKPGKYGTTPRLPRLRAIVHHICRDYGHSGTILPGLRAIVVPYLPVLPGPGKYGTVVTGNIIPVWYT